MSMGLPCAWNSSLFIASTTFQCCPKASAARTHQPVSRKWWSVSPVNLKSRLWTRSRLISRARNTWRPFRSDNFFNFYSVTIKDQFFYKIKFCVSYYWRCPGTFVTSATQLTLSLYLWSSGSNTRCEARALEWRHVSSRSHSRVHDRDEGVGGRNYRE